MACADAAQHPGSDYYVDRLSGQIQRAGGWLGVGYRYDPGWSGPYDWCAAKAFAGSSTGSAVIHSPQNVLAKATGLSGGNLAGWVLRIAEMALGLILIAAGVAKITNAVPAATAIARKIR